MYMMIVEKLGCVGHVQKRMGKHLLNLNATTKGKLSHRKTIGGKGRLTEAKCKYYEVFKMIKTAMGMMCYHSQLSHHVFPCLFICPANRAQAVQQIPSIVVLSGARA